MITERLIQWIFHYTSEIVCTLIATYLNTTTPTNITYTIIQTRTEKHTMKIKTCDQQ